MAIDLYTSHMQRKKIGFEALKMGIDLYTSSTYTRVNTVCVEWHNDSYVKLWNLFTCSFTHFKAIVPNMKNYEI